MRTTTRWQLAAALMALLALLGAATGCSSSDSDQGAEDAGDTSKDMTISVPEDFDTIQDAVDDAPPGALILVGPGTYHEDVDVTTENLTIRGLDRNTVILDGEFELE